MKHIKSIEKDGFGFVEFAVSSYLLLAGLWLLTTGRIRSSAFGKIIRSGLRARYADVVRDPKPEQGYCFKASLPSTLLSDLESASRLRVYENGIELGPAHSSHEDVRLLGRGRFAHWNADLYFSTSDNSDPRTNGRRYEVRETA